jgi:EmrB/QacA subfamily drug resistance transporter
VLLQIDPRSHALIAALKGNVITSPSAQLTAAAASIHDPRQRREILLAVCIALMAVIASVSGLNVAQPPIAVDLDASQGEVLWMINTYAITLAALLLPLGAVGDRWGRKPVLLAGLAIFGVANVIAGLAPSTAVMLMARFLSGVGAAMVMPVTLSVITSVFPDKERSAAIGVWTAVAGGGGILGMFLSAVLVDLVSWRWLFVLPVVLVSVAAVMTLRAVPNSRDVQFHGFDIVGSVVSLIAVLGLILFLHEGPERGWTAPVTLLSLLVGISSVVAFVIVERRQPAPLLDITLFQKRNLTAGALSLLTWFGVQAGVFVVLFPFFQAVLGWSSLLATLALMPMAILMMTSSGLAPRVAARVGARLTMATGMALGVTGMVLMALLVSVDGGYLSVLPGMTAMGLGMGLSMTPSTEAITSSLPRERQGVASALNDVTREFGTAIGVALLGAVFTAGYQSSIAPRLNGVPTDAAAAAHRGIAGVLTLADEAQPSSMALLRSAQESFVQGWQQSMWAGAGVLIGLLVYVLARGPGAPSDKSRAGATANRSPLSASAVTEQSEKL